MRFKPMTHVSFIRGQAKGDPEKAILPTAMYVSTANETAVARSVTLGWWDFYIGILWAKKRPTISTPETPHDR